jgi:UDP-N-acetylmuramoylalanine--D-glutamate ligase
MMQHDVRGKRVTVAGLGRFGGAINAAKWLVAQGAKVLVTDQSSAEKLRDSLRQLEGLEIEYRLGEHRTEDFTSAELIVPSPAIPPSSPHLLAAAEARVPVALEIQLFIERCPCRIVGVTGTKGKSTTTRLLGLMLETTHRTWTGGNLGGSLLFQLPQMTADDIVVLELSSFMLHWLGQAKWSPSVGLVTMISSDHLEWHGTADAYVQAKKNLVLHQSPDDVAVLNEENDVTRQWGSETAARVVRFGVRDRDPFDLALPGAHNQLNAQGAFAAARELGVTREQAQHAIRDFKGLPHRLQIVHEADGVRWVNDSIATIPEAAVAAMRAFPRSSVIQIIGGYDKGLPMRQMCEALAHECRAVLTIGKTGPLLAQLVRQCVDSSAELSECETLERAVNLASQLARSGDTVLLSTGCASYDQFANFEHRGDEFTRLVRACSA